MFFIENTNKGRYGNLAIMYANSSLFLHVFSHDYGGSELDVLKPKVTAYISQKKAITPKLP